jgi:23S rRNA pseudouridine1911/1915/1917 synthase
LVRVDGELRPKRWTLSEGEAVEILPAVAAEIPDVGPQPKLEPVYIDEWIVVSDKPAGIVSHPAPGHPTGTLAQILQARLPGREVGLVHRLDRDTSGLLIAALDPETLRELRERLQRREIVREYTALVMGRPKTAEGTIEAAIGRDSRSRTKVSTRTDSPRSAVTHFETLEVLDEAALLRVRLETGRTHQIRVHLAEIGLPVAGDPTYGRQGAWGLSRQFLHASRLHFTHPVTGESIELRSELPDDLREALELARRGERP